MQILDEILHHITPEEIYEGSSIEDEETDIESDFGDDIPDDDIIVPRLQLDRLLTSRSIRSGMHFVSSKITLGLNV